MTTKAGAHEPHDDGADFRPEVEPHDDGPPIEPEVVDDDQDDGPPQSALEMIGLGEARQAGGTGSSLAAKVDALGNRELAVIDPAATMMAAQMESAVKARFAIAVARPRDPDAARMKIERECRRPGFAEVARYDLERHSRGSGPSARFAELAARCWGNLDTGSFIVSDTPEGRRIYCYCTDLETNVTEHEMIFVRRTVERSSSGGREAPAGMDEMPKRAKPRGGFVFIVRATDEEMDAKCKNYVSRTLRVLRLRHIPGDVVDECMAIVVAVKRDHEAKDPDHFRKVLLRSFMTLNVTPEDLAEYLGHPFSKATPRELSELKSVGVRIRDDDEYQWEDALAAKLDQRGQAAAPRASTNDAGEVGDAILGKAAKAKSKPSGGSSR